MKARRSLPILVLIAIVFILNVAGCSNNSTQTGTDDILSNQLNVVVSILPQADLVKMIGGENVKITVMIPPGATPDSFEPSTGDLKNVSKADLYIQVGHLPFEEAWMDRILAANKNLILVNSSEGIEIIDHDPHIWLSPRLAKVQVETICEAFIKVDENNKELYMTNLEQTLTKLDNIDKEIAAKLANVKGQTILVYHPAWGYFANDYGLHEMAIEDHGKEPGPAEMAKIIATAKTQGIKTVFTSPQHSTRSAEAVASELGAKVVTIDPLPSNYEDIVKSAELISEALGGK